MKSSGVRGTVKTERVPWATGETAFLIPSDGESNDNFGAAVDIEGDTVELVLR